MWLGNVADGIVLQSRFAQEAALLVLVVALSMPHRRPSTKKTTLRLRVSRTVWDQTPPD